MPKASAARRSAEADDADAAEAEGTAEGRRQGQLQAPELQSEQPHLARCQHPARRRRRGRRPAADPGRRLRGPADANRGIVGRDPGSRRRRRDRRRHGKGDRAQAAVDNDSAKLVRGSAYSLALPAGWKQIAPQGGATFAAVADDGGADAQLWISEDPKLDFPTFVRQSLTQLEALAGSARIVSRAPAPSADETIVTLAADAPSGQPSYEVPLRVSGPYRYYLATSVQPDASREAVEGSELISGSFEPEAQG